MKTNFYVARQCIITIGRCVDKNSIDACGITIEDLKLITGQGYFVNSNRSRVEQVFKSLVYGTIDALGLPRFKIPAEYIAACIAFYVHPNNHHVACSWFQTPNTAATLARAAEEFEPGIPDYRLFALVQELLAEDALTNSHALFEKQTGIMLDYAKTKVVNEPAAGKK